MFEPSELDPGEPIALSRVLNEVRAVLSSPHESQWSVLSGSSGSPAVSLSQHEGVVRICTVIQLADRPNHEQAVRTFFASRGLNLGNDYLAANGGVPNAVRILDAPLPPDPVGVAEVLVGFLREVHGMSTDGIVYVRRSNETAA